LIYILHVRAIFHSPLLITVTFLELARVSPQLYLLSPEARYFLMSLNHTSLYVVSG